MLYIVAAFSLSMLKNLLETLNDVSLNINTCTLEEAKGFVRKFESFSPAVGHKDTASIMQKQLDIRTSLFDRKTVSLKRHDILLVGQYIGERLPEGATELPLGAKIEYMLVEVK